MNLGHESAFKWGTSLFIRRKKQKLFAGVINIKNKRVKIWLEFSIWKQALGWLLFCTCIYFTYTYILVLKCLRKSLIDLNIYSLLIFLV